MIARAYERAGGIVLVAENGYLGRDWRGEHWYALSKNYHNGAGEWNIEGEERWDLIGDKMQPWRTGGDEVVVLATRHIGPVGVAEPHGWSELVFHELRSRGVKVRIRKHPGEGKCVDLAEDLENANAVVTWGSGAGLKALLLGIPVYYGFKKWIGASAAHRYDGQVNHEGVPRPDRLAMFRRLAWAMWNTEELASGRPFKCLVQ